MGNCKSRKSCKSCRKLHEDESPKRKKTEEKKKSEGGSSSRSSICSKRKNSKKKKKSEDGSSSRSSICSKRKKSKKKKKSEDGSSSRSSCSKRKKSKRKKKSEDDSSSCSSSCSKHKKSKKKKRSSRCIRRKRKAGPNAVMISIRRVPDWPCGNTVSSQGTCCMQHVSRRKGLKCEGESGNEYGDKNQYSSDDDVCPGQRDPCQFNTTVEPSSHRRKSKYLRAPYDGQLNCNDPKKSSKPHEKSAASGNRQSEKDNNVSPYNIGFMSMSCPPMPCPPMPCPPMPCPPMPCPPMPCPPMPCPPMPCPPLPGAPMPCPPMPCPPMPCPPMPCPPFPFSPFGPLCPVPNQKPCVCTTANQKTCDPSCTACSP